MPRSPRVRRLLGIPVALGAAALAFLPGAPAQATPLACTTNCNVLAHFFAYVTPVTEVAAGAPLTWSSLDVSHPTAENTPDVPCFRAEMSGGTTSAPVTFSVDNGVVTAHSLLGSRTCTSATSVGGVTYAIPYHCLVHPNMVGAVLVSE